ncbi:MAG: hypothetical protein OEZ04_03270 [Nitrospinota bacterium]|nr:hypothetical protein [Nitrospinota bacterium]
MKKLALALVITVAISGISGCGSSDEGIDATKVQGIWQVDHILKTSCGGIGFQDWAKEREVKAIGKDNLSIRNLGGGTALTAAVSKTSDGGLEWVKQYQYDSGYYCKGSGDRVTVNMTVTYKFNSDKKTGTAKKVMELTSSCGGCTGRDNGSMTQLSSTSREGSFRAEPKSLDMEEISGGNAGGAFARD